MHQFFRFEECGRQIVTVLNLINSLHRTGPDASAMDLETNNRLHKLHTQAIEQARQFVWQ